MPNEAKRVILGLDLNEVSLVDEGANETPVAVMKRKETDDMTIPAEATNQNKPAAESGTTPNAAPVTKNGGDIEHVEVEAEGNEDVLKRLTSAVEALVAKHATPEAPKVEQATAEDIAKAKSLTELLKSTGMSEADVEKAVAIACPTVQKAATAAPTQSKEEAGLDVLDALSDVLTKAKKFTPKRLAQLQEVTQKLQGLLADLNSGKPDEGEGESKVEKSAAPAPASAPAPAPAGPSMDEAIAKALAPVLTELEKLKNTHTPSTAAPTGTEAGSPKPKTESVTKSFWSGVL